MAFAILAWADCIFSLQGNSQDLHTGSGIRRHASCYYLLNETQESIKKDEIMVLSYSMRVDWTPIIIGGIVLLVLLYFLIFPLLIAKAARKRGRSGFFWFLVALFISPLLAILILILLGDTDSKRREKIVSEELLRNRLRDTSTQTCSNQENHRLQQLLQQTRHS